MGFLNHLRVHLNAHIPVCSSCARSYSNLSPRIHQSPSLYPRSTVTSSQSINHSFLRLHAVIQNTYARHRLFHDSKVLEAHSRQRFRNRGRIIRNAKRGDSGRGAHGRRKLGLRLDGLKSRTAPTSKKTLKKKSTPATSRRRLSEDIGQSNTHNTGKSTRGRLIIARTLKPNQQQNRQLIPRPSFSRIKPPASSLVLANIKESDFDSTSIQLYDSAREVLPLTFASPPLSLGLLKSVKEALGEEAKPTAIQSLALRYMFSGVKYNKSGSASFVTKDEQKEGSKESLKGDWKQYLLASETGSGKSMAYLLPLLHYLKQTEHLAQNDQLHYQGSQHRRPSTSTNPRALIVAPTHELVRQLSIFCKELVHIEKLRVLCASRENSASTSGFGEGVKKKRQKRSGDGSGFGLAFEGTARSVKMMIDEVASKNGIRGNSKTHEDEDADGLEFTIRPSHISSSASAEYDSGPGSRQQFREIDILITTPRKALELIRGHGWEKAKELDSSEVEYEFSESRNKSKEREHKGRRGKHWLDEAEDVEDVKDVNGGRDGSGRSNGDKWVVKRPSMGVHRVEWVVVDEADILYDEDFREQTELLLDDIGKARGVDKTKAIATTVSDKATTQANKTPPQAHTYPFHLTLSTATIPSSLSHYLSTHLPDLLRLASPNLHKLPKSIKLERTGWTGGNKNADVLNRIKRVWAEDALRGPQVLQSLSQPGAQGETKGRTGMYRSKILIFCNKRSKVEELGEYLSENGVENVRVTGKSETRMKSVGSNKHLYPFLKSTEHKSVPAVILPQHQSVGFANTNTIRPTQMQNPPPPNPYVILTTSLLSRGLDFSPNLRHVFILDSPRNMIDFLHRAGRTGRAGVEGRVVVFVKARGRNRRRFVTTGGKGWGR